jgi:hypothetical protein
MNDVEDLLRRSFAERSTEIVATPDLLDRARQVRPADGPRLHRPRFQALGAAAAVMAVVVSAWVGIRAGSTTRTTPTAPPAHAPTQTARPPAASPAPLPPTPASRPSGSHPPGGHPVGNSPSVSRPSVSSPVGPVPAVPSNTAPAAGPPPRQGSTGPAAQAGPPASQPSARTGRNRTG